MARKKHYQWEKDSPEAQEERPLSRSEKKRRCLALQALGERLAKLPLPLLPSLPLPPDLERALRELQRISDHEGRRRQKQYIGRLMREADAEALEAALTRLQSRT